MKEKLFCISCGDSVSAKTDKCKNCKIEIWPFRELLELSEISDSYMRSVKYRKSKIIIKEKRSLKENIELEISPTNLIMSIGKYFLILLIVVGLFFLGTNYFFSNDLPKISEKSTNEIKQSNSSILDEQAAQFFAPGDALITLTQVWGIKLNDESGPRILRDVIDDIYFYLSSVTPGGDTKESISIAFQPGNSLNSFFSRLVSDEEAYDAIVRRLIKLAN